MLPTKINAARIDAPVENVQPGSWWRLVDPEHELNARRWAPSVERPEHGVILLVSEVRVIDGEIHTIILHNHPGWENRGQVALLAEDFLTAFVEAPDGEELRAQELANLMGQITMISQSMADIPEDTKLLQDAKTDNNEGDVEPAPGCRL